MVTQKRLHELFEYVDGSLIRNGKIAGGVNKRGYRVICVDCKIYKAHRLVFLYHHGYLPEQIDHIDGDKLNNHIENLRPATNGQNCMNRGMLRNNTSGCKGVFWDRETSKWRVAIRVGKKLKSFGRYYDIELAELVAMEARNKYHKEFANHGVKIMAVNLSPVGGVAGQFFDNNGDPLVGGKLYTYAAGTTTPQTTYTSSLGTTPNSNPIILNAGGRVPSEIWLTDGLSYKFVLYTSTDQLVGSWDDISGINSNFVNFTSSQEIQTATSGQTVFTLTTMQYQPGTNSLTVYVDGVNQYGPGAPYAYVETDSTTVTFNAGLHVGAEVKFTTVEQATSSATDAASVAYQPAGTGAVTTNVQAKLRETVSVKDFGAVGDGVTDDTVAIQAALDYWVANRCDLVFPAGQYLVTSPLTAIAASTKTDGNRLLGYGATLKGSLSASGVLLKIGVNGALWRYFTIEGLTLLGDVNETDLLLLDGGSGGSAEYLYGWELHRVNCEAFPGNGITITRNAFEGTLVACNSRTSNTTGYCIYINYGTGAVSSISLIDCTTSGGLKGVYAPSPVSDIRIWGGTYILAQEEGIRLDNALGGQVSNLHLERNWEGAANFAASGAGLALSASQNFTVSGCVGTTNNKQQYVVRAFAGTNASVQIIGGSNSGLITTYAQLEGTNSGASDVRGFTLIGNHTYVVVGSPSVMQIKGEKTVLGYTRKQVVNSSGTVTITPDPRNGKSVFFVHQTGNAIINAPSAYTPEDGDEIEFIFEQGGSGGYSVTFAADYMVNWTPSTTFGHRNAISFRYAGNAALGSGKQWVQVASAVGLT